MIRGLPRLIGSALLGGFTAWGQDPQGDEPAAPNTAILKQHPDPTQITDRAPKLAAEGRFGEALDVYLAALESHGDNVIPVTRERYVGVRSYVLEAIRGWPAQGLEVYRSRFDPQLRDRFHQARAAADPEALRAIIRDVPFSRTAAHAALHVAHLLHESGRPAEAVEAIHALLRLAPDSLDAPMAALLADVFARRGETARLEALARRAAQLLPDARILLGDREVPLADHLAEGVELSKKAARPAPKTPVDASWPMLGGNAASTRVAPHAFVPRPPAWTARLPEVVYGSPDASRFFGGEDWSWRRAGYHPVHPAVEDGIVLVHNGATARAYPLFAPAADPLWTHQISLPERKPLMFEERIAHASTLHEGRAYVTLVTHVLEPEQQQGYLQVKYPFPKRALFCLDALTGRVLWRLGGNPDGPEPDDQLSFSMAPTALDGRLYVPAVQQRLAQDPFKHFVLCLDAATGRVIWRSYVASGGTEINLFGNSIREAVCSKVAVTAERVFTCTNLGVVAALDRETGSVEWALRYLQLPIRPTRQFPPPRYGLTWRNNPVVATDEAVIAAPVDSSELVALDPSNGRVLYTIDQARHRVNSIYGVRGQTLVLGGEFVRLFDAPTGRLIAQLEPFGRARGAGTGTIAGSRVYHPTEAGLSILDLDTRREAQFMPWRHVQGANVVIAEHAMLAAAKEDMIEASPEPVTRDEVLARLAESPADPVAMHHAAQRLLQLAIPLEACDLLERAAKAADAAPRADVRRFAASSRRLLVLTLRRLAADKAAASDLEAAEAVLGRAMLHAATPAERVELALERAEILIARKRHDRLVDEMQELIRTAPDLRVGARTAFEIARERIETAIALRTREIYRDWDRAAREEYEQARAAGSVERLTGVYRRYPNSEAAPSALLDASKLLLDSGRSAELMRWTRVVVREHASHERIADAYALMALSLERRGLFGGARRLLLKMKRDLSERRVTIDGEAAAVPEFVDKRLARADYAQARDAEAGRPLDPPFQKQADIEDPGLAAPLPPDTPPRGKAASYFAASTGARSVAIFDLTEGRRVARIETPGPAIGFAWAGETLIVRGSRYLLAVDAASGETLWKRDDGDAMSATAMMDEFVLTAGATEGGQPVTRVSAVSISTGESAWTIDVAGAVRSLHPLGEEALVRTTAPERLVTLEIETGRVLAIRDFGGEEPRTVLWAAPDLVVLEIQGDAGTGAEAYVPGRFERPLWRRIPRGERGAVLADAQWTVMLYRDRIEWVSAATGKLTHRVPVDLRRPGARALGPDETLYLIEGDTLRAWRRDEAQGQADLPAEGARDRRVEAHGAHVLMLENAYDPVASKFMYSALLFEKGSLRRLQHLSSEFRFETPPTLSIWNGLLLVGVEGKLVVYR